MADSPNSDNFNMTSPSPATELFGRVAYYISEMQPFFPMYLHLILSSLFPIFTGAHASLSRPSSAAKPTKRDKTKDKSVEEEDNEEEKPIRMEGLSATDAIMFPLLAGATLSGLYFLIKWLQDAALLNKILNWYFSGFAVFSVGRLATDCLVLLRNMVFPKYYLDGGVIWKVDDTERRAIPDTSSELQENTRTSPLPGSLSRIPLPFLVNSQLWLLRTRLFQRVIARLHIRRIVSGKASIGITGLLGSVIGVFCVFYFNFVSRPWFLTNILGFAFAYSALQIMSPTTFTTGSLILSALFLYDIYFVFYTPMMVTVAKELDIPIKLLFPRPAPEDAGPDQLSLSMLGLGDVVIPGIVIGLALRFDLYMHYLRKQERKQVSNQVSEQTDGSTEHAEKDGSSTKTKDEAVWEVSKAPYKSVSGRWADRFWSQSWSDMCLPTFAKDSKTEPSAVPAMSFPKPYFYATIFGYVLGMCVTLVVMQIADHAQPALLYLVPGVLGSAWLTGILRGEIKEMWKYDEMTEDEQDEQDQKKHEAKGTQDAKESGRKSFFSTAMRQRRTEALKKSIQKHISKDDEVGEATGESNNEQSRNEDEEMRQDGDDDPKLDSARRPSRDLFSRDRSHELIFFSITLPPETRTESKNASYMSSEKMGEDDTIETANGTVRNGITPSAPGGPRVQRRQVNGEPSGKRQRIT